MNAHTLRSCSLALSLAGLSLVAVGCGQEGSNSTAALAPSPLQIAAFTNGDFESTAIGSAPTSWTVSSNLNPSITDTRPSPQTLASLNLSTGGYAATFVVGGTTPESVADPDLGTSASLRYPKYGARAARVNYASTTQNGSSANVNSMTQTMTIANGDIDTSDNKAHVRFVIAPVLEDGGHPYTQQPYYYVQLQNLTKGTTLYQDFNASAQPGVPWKTVGSVDYTDWQLVDIAPGNAALAVGDQVKLTVIAGGCSPGGHFGRVYVDGIGSTVPGIYAYATAPTSVNAGSNIAYTINYKNGGTATTAATTLAVVLPTSTTYQSVSIPGACTAPAVGSAGTVTCTLGALAPGSSGSFTLTVQVAAGTAAGTTITNGDYYIYATGVNPLLGPKVLTSVTSGVTYADVGITKSDGVAALGWGQSVTYTIVASNSGPSTAASVTVADTMPAQLTGVTWSCVGSGGGSCTASGSGNLNDTAATLPVGASATYTVRGTIVSGTGTGSITNTATATVGGTVQDPSTGNNTAVDTDSIGPLQTLSLTKSGAAGGTVASVPLAISCGTSCSSASGSFVNGTQVVLTASAVAGGVFSGWGGACASAGSSPSCTVTMSADQSVSATFVPPPTITVSSGNNQSAAVGTAFAAPLKALVVDSSGNPISGAVVAFSAPASGASATLSAATATTNAQGIASITATANATAGAYQVAAGISGTTATTNFSLSNYGTPASISVVSGSGQSTTVSAAFAAPLVAVVRDSVSQIVPGVTVTLMAPTTGARATLGPSNLATMTATTDATGQVSVAATAGASAGSYVVTASVSGVTTAATFALSNSPGAAASVTVSGGGTQSATVNTVFATALMVTVTDAQGNPIPNAVVSFVAPTTGARATFGATGTTSATATTDASGHASVAATAGTVIGGYAVTAAVSGVMTAASFSLSNTAGAAAALTASGGSSQSAQVGTSFAAQLVVTVKDAFGNPVTGAVVGTTLPPGTSASATLSGSTTTNSAGQISLTATANSIPGNYVVTASITGAGSATYSLTNYAALALSPATASVAPRGAKSFTASGGPGSSYTYGFATNASGGTINATTGAYVAGPTPNVTDVVKVSDGTGSVATASVTVGAGVSISPTAASVAPRGSKTFIASGGSGTGLTFSLTVNGSGGSVNSTSGAYTAGPTASTTDVVTATDSLGNIATATISVGAGISISPATASVAPRGSKTFTASGGSGTGLTFSLTTNGSGATINASTGAYVAGGTANSTDVVTVVDSLGNSATASISVGGGLTIAPNAVSLAPRATKTFTVSGGSGAGLTFSLATNGSGATINASTGAYAAGVTGNSTDVVKVVDSLGNSATATVTVSAGVALSPATASVPPRGGVALTASGGSASGFMYAVTMNASGGSVDAMGRYTAGSTANVADVVTVTDSLGNTATSTITVGPGVALAGSATVAPPRGSLTFSASGGAGTGFAFTLSTNASGGTIDPVSGAYVAGATPSVTDVVTATDPLGNSATANVAVGAGVSVTPASPATPPRGPLTLVASGGSGTGYGFALSTNGSGATIGAATGVYTAGPVGSTSDVVTVTDSLGNTATVSISVGGGLTLSPAAPIVAPRQSQTFTSAGGSGSGLVFALSTNGSGATINPATGVYTAGATGGSSDIVTVTDSLGNTATSTITVGPGLQVVPGSATLAPLGRQGFAVSGGSGVGYAFALTTNNSNGNVNPATGDYQAGAVGSVVDLITATDSLGNVATIQVTVTAALAPVQSSVSIAPRGNTTLAVAGGAGGVTFALTVNGSGGSIDPRSGHYIAGPNGGTSDLVTATDANGVFTTFTVTIGPGVALAPATPSVAPRGALTFTASGGSGAGFSYVLTTNPSGGSIDPATGAYEAGPNASTVDVVVATDSLGNSATVSISVGGGLVLTPSAPTVAPRGGLSFSAFGGSGSGYTYALGTNLSGGSIVPATGAYTAGPSANVVDVVTVTDALGNTASTNVSVGGGVLVSPVSATVPPQGTLAFTASGGSGAGFAFALTNNLSGATIDPATGAYVAGPLPLVTDTITVTDSLGNSAVATVTVGPGVTASAPSTSVPPRGGLTVTAAGGSGHYTFTFQVDGSGGNIVSSTGVYTAGSKPNTGDVLLVTDSLGNTATVAISVGAGVTLTPTAPLVAPSGSVAFSASGGSGTGFTYALTTNASGATIDATSGAYRAGATPNATDVVTATDSLGNSAMATVNVGNGVALSPGASTIAPRATVQFAVTGGSGTGYVFSLTSGPSGGTIDPSSGLYKAGATPNVTDEVMVTDSLGKSATAQVTVGPGVSLTPAATSVAPAGTLTFTVAGGGGSGYTFVLAAGGSGATIDPTSGAYKAGAIGATIDVVTAADSLGNSATAMVTVTAGLSVASPNITVAPKGTNTLAVAGGAGPYHFLMTTNGSGGSVNPTTGAYVAGATGNSTDVVTVTDANGMTTTVTITVGPGITIGPPKPGVSAGGSVQLSASGGSGSGYSWSIVDASGGGTVDPTSGIYTAPKNPTGTDVVQVTDSNGNVATVAITPTPASVTVGPGSPLHLAGGGGCSVAGEGSSSVSFAFLIVAAALVGRRKSWS